jgi:predicted dienelactone hydrolase
LKTVLNRILVSAFALAATAIGMLAQSSEEASAAVGGAAGPIEGPALTGHFSVGRQLDTWIDVSRKDPTDTTRSRAVPVSVWYPASPSSDISREAPLPTEWEKDRIELLSTKLGDMARGMGDFKVRAQTNGKLLSGKSTFPVLLFTPGLGWLASDYSVLIEDLVSHGYVVVGLSPVGFADVVQLPDGHEVKRTLGLGEKIGADQSIVWDDAMFALKQIRNLNSDAESFLHNRLDLTRIGAFGHSLGGTTALVIAARDTSVRAAINIDGDPMGDVVNVRPKQPLLLISSESPDAADAPDVPSPQTRDLIQKGLERSEARRTNDWVQISASSSSAYRVRVMGTRHLNFPDAALASERLTTPKQRWMKVGPIAGARGLEIELDLVRSFFDRTLLGSSGGDWSPAEAAFPEVRLETKSRR